MSNLPFSGQSKLHQFGFCEVFCVLGCYFLSILLIGEAESDYQIKTADSKMRVSQENILKLVQEREGRIRRCFAYIQSTNLIRAGSRSCFLLVAAITTTFLSCSKPSICTKKITIWYSITNYIGLLWTQQLAVIHTKILAADMFQVSTPWIIS